ncbi:MAG: response regulator, partial [Bacteroidota bacterium]
MTKSYIICIDDETIVLDSLQSELRMGFEDEYLIEVSENAQDALNLVEELLEQSCDIPIVICDYIMPEMKGDELLSLIHQLSPETRTILLTGQSNIEGITNAINHANLYRFISKPWNSQDLQLTIREGIKSYYQQKDIAAQNQKLKEMNTILEKKVKQRTAALENTLAVLHQKNQILEVKNHEIESSIRYAQRIQKATLPSQHTLSDYLDEHFLIFKPRDVVSGDFYWCYQMEEQQFPRLGKVSLRPEAQAPVILVLADCTGHGVPGAFMSMIGNNLLNQIVIQQGIQTPTRILSLLNEGIYKALQ